MVTMTRAEAKEVFNHVLNVVLDRNDSSSLKTSLLKEGIADIFDLITITDDIIDNLNYKDSADNTLCAVRKGDKMLLRCFLAYHQLLEELTSAIDYKSITQADFDSYRISPAYRSMINPPPPVTSSSTVPLTDTFPSTYQHTSNTKEC